MSIRSSFYIIFIWILASEFSVCAQKPDWIRNSVSAGDSYAETIPSRIAVHPDGSIYVAGLYSGSNDFNGQVITSSPGNTFYDVFLAKYNSDGDLLWLKQIFQSEGYYSNKILDLKIDDNGDLVFSGSCLWPSSILGSQTGTGYFIAKTDGDADLKWLHFLPPTGGSIHEHNYSRRGNRLQFDPDHNILWLTDQINEFAPSGSLSVVKYSSDGTQLATLPVTRNSTFDYPSITDFSVDDEGNFIVSGNFTSTVSLSGGPTLSNTNGRNTNPIQFFVAKFTASGNFLWVVSSTFQGNLVAAHTVDSNGNVYLALHLDGGASILTPYETVNIPNSQRPIVKISKDGKLEWMNLIQNTNVRDIYLAADGLLYITGNAFGTDLRYQSYIRSIDGTSGFLLKVNTDGNFYGLYLAAPEDEPSSLQAPDVNAYQTVVDGDGNIYTIGGFNERLVWNCVPAVTDRYAFFLVKQIPTGSPIRTIDGPGVACEGSEITLSTDLVSNGVVYKWFTPDLTAPPTGTVLKNSETIMVSPAYQNQVVIVSITDNCDEYFAEPYIFNVRLKPIQPVLNKSKNTVCPDTSEEFRIQTKPDISYLWTLPDGIAGPLLADDGGMLNFRSDFTEGTIKIGASNACGSKELSFDIRSFNTPVAPQLSGNLVICPGFIPIQKSIQPVADAESYLWELPPHMGFDVSGPSNGITLNAVTDNIFQSGEIRVRAVGKCKTSAASSPLIISRVKNPGSIGSMDGPREICTTSGTVTYTIPPIENVNKYTWLVPHVFDKKGIQVTAEPFIDLKAQQAGAGEVKVHGENECKVTTQDIPLEVTTYAPLQQPVLTISPCDTEIQVSGNENFLWYLNGVRAPQLSGSILMVLDSGIYHVEAENFCGITQSNRVKAYPIINSTVLIPNVITPNGDGKNDFLVIDKSLPESDVLVINRWGETVYAAYNYQNTWNAEGISPGTYFLTVRNPCLPSGGYKGWISVVK